MAWSWYRDRMFAFCPRSYRLHYEGGRGGFDAYAEQQRRLVYRLKKLSDVPRWLDEIMSEAIRACVPWSEKEFRQDLLRRFSVGRRQALCGWWNEDPVFLNLSELYYGDEDPEHLFEQAQDELRRRCRLAEDSPLKELFSGLNPLSFVRVKYPLAVEVNLVEAWTAPLQIWRDGETLFFLNRFNPEAELYAGALQCVWAMRQLNTPPERIYFAAYDFNDGAYREYPAKELEISSALQRIEDRAREFLTSDCAANTENCRRCRFRECCSEY